MTRYGAQFGPDITFLGVDPVDLEDAGGAGRGRRRGRRGAVRRRYVAPARAPASGRRRSGRPTTCRTTARGRTSRCASTRCRTSGCVDAGDVEMPPGEIERALHAPRGGGVRRRAAGRDPAGARRRPLDRAPRRDRRGPAPRLRQGVDDPLRRPRRHRRHRVRLALRPRPADAPADRVAARCAATGSSRWGCAATGPGPRRWSWMAEQNMRSYEMTEIGKRGLDACLDEAFEIALDDCDAVFLSVDIDVCDPGHAPGTGTPEPGGLSVARSCSTPYAGSAASCRSPASTWSRCRRRTTTPRSPRTSPTGSASRRSRGSPPRRSGSPTTPPARCCKIG